MPQRFMRMLHVGCWMLLLAAAPAAAQLSDNLGSLSGDNAKGYLGPLPKALSGTLNSAIFTTGNVPKAAINFTIGVKLMGVGFKDEDRTYQPTDPPGFTSQPNQPPVPTIIGDGQAVTQQGQGGTQMDYPGGFDLGEFAIGVPQLSIGSIAGTRATVRWISLDLGESDFGKFDLFGIGAQHSISQYMKDLPVDLAVGVFYQSFKIDEDLLKTTAFHVDVTGSKSYGFLQPYAALGYDTFTMKTHYEDSNNPGNSIDVDFDNQNNMHFTAGLLVNLPVVKLHGEFNAAATTGVAVGLSFGK
jgi:hypothetical protein